MRYTAIDTPKSDQMGAILLTIFLERIFLYEDCCIVV